MFIECNSPKASLISPILTKSRTRHYKLLLRTHQSELQAAAERSWVLVHLRSGFYHLYRVRCATHWLSLEGHPRTGARSSFWGGVSGGSERDGTAPSALGVCSNYVHNVIKISWKKRAWGAIFWWVRADKVSGCLEERSPLNPGEAKAGLSVV